MPSLISHFFRFTMRRASIFGKPGEPVAVRRAKIEKLVRLAPTPAGLTVTPVEIRLGESVPVPAEWEVPTGAPDDRVLLYIHGGAWIICSPRSHRGMVAQIARAAGMKALSIDYRLAPEHPFPAGLEDCLTAYRWIVAQGISPRKIVIAGDSAGGNLALALLLALRDAQLPLPALAVCICPWTDVSNAGASMTRNEPFDWVEKRMADRWAEWLCSGADASNPLVSPILADLSGLPPVYIQAGEAEILYDMIRAFDDCARQQGANVQLESWPHMIHDFQAFGDRLPESRAALRRIGEVVRETIS
jgi:acetyl esterase/lipase